MVRVNIEASIKGLGDIGYIVISWDQSLRELKSKEALTIF